MRADTALLILRRQVEAVETNYIGPEGRGAARSVQRDVLRLIDRQVLVLRQSEARARGMHVPQEGA